jgi:hypothetical protein
MDLGSMLEQETKMKTCFALMAACLVLLGCEMPMRDGVKVPSLFNGEEVMHKFKDLTPLGWAYCLDMTTGEEKEAVKRAFDEACETDPSLMGKVSEWFATKAKVDLATRNRRRR